MKSKDTKAIIIGRFQVPFFNEDHEKAIQEIINSHDSTTFVVGLSYCSASLEDPLSLKARKFMIGKAFGAWNVTTAYIKDSHDDSEWSERLDSLIDRQKDTPRTEVTIFGSQTNFIDRYQGVYKNSTKAMTRISVENINTIKKMIDNISFSILEDPALAYRLGAFHVALNTFNNPMPVVDMAVVDKNRGRILLGRKEGQTLYRFFGGFAENHIKDYEEDALRELEEEASLHRENLGDPEYITSMLIDDWRYRSVERKIKTALFLVPYLSGTPKANDDIEEVRWFDLDTFRLDYRNLLVRSHVQLADVLMHRLNFKK